MVQPKKKEATEEQKERQRQNQQRYRDRNKQKREESNPSPPKKKLKDMSVEERREYNRQKQRESRAKSVDAEESTENLKPSDDREDEIIPERRHNVKMRIGYFNIFDAETDVIVIPYYDRDFYPGRKASPIHAQMLRLFENHKDYSQFENDFERRNRCQDFDWNQILHWVWSDRNNHRQLTFHLKPPFVKLSESKYSIFDELRLRGSYMSCIIEAEKLNCRSISIPILGHNIPKERSLALGIQTIFAYLQSVEYTQLELIYLVTNDPELYRKLGEFLFYIKEIDFLRWDRKLYFAFEKLIFDRLTSGYHFSSIPGTNMVLRATVVLRKMCDDDNVENLLTELNDLHTQQSKLTNMKTGEFKVYTSQSHNQYVLPTQFMKVDRLRRESTNIRMISEKVPANRFCGTNSFLRNLWIISRFFMYFQGESFDAADFVIGNENFEQRKADFLEKQNWHIEVLKEYKDAIRDSPYECTCKDDDVNHKQLSPFMTPLSHHDVLFDKLILCHRSLVYIPSSTSIRNFPVVYTGGDFKVILLRNGIFLNGLETVRTLCWTENREHIFQKQKEERSQLIQSLQLQYPIDSTTQSVVATDPKQFDLSLDSDANQNNQNRYINHLHQDLELEKKWRISLFSTLDGWKLDIYHEKLLSLQLSPHVLMLKSSLPDDLLNVICNMISCCEPLRRSVRLFHDYSIFSSQMWFILRKLTQNTDRLRECLNLHFQSQHMSLLQLLRNVMKVLNEDSFGLFRMSSQEITITCQCYNRITQRIEQEEMPTHIELNVGEGANFGKAIEEYINSQIKIKACCAPNRTTFHFHHKYLIFIVSTEDGSFVDFPECNGYLFNWRYNLVGFVELCAQGYFRSWVKHRHEWNVAKDDKLEKRTTTMDPHSVKLLVYELAEH